MNRISFDFKRKEVLFQTISKSKKPGQNETKKGGRSVSKTGGYVSQGKTQISSYLHRLAFIKSTSPSVISPFLLSIADI